MNLNPTNKYNNDNKYNEFKKVYNIRDDMGVTLKQLLEKYNYDIGLINYEPNDIITDDPNKLKYYSIDYRGTKFGEIIVDYSHPYNPDNDTNAWVGTICCCPIERLLNLTVNISTWNEYSWDDNTFNEKTIADKLYKILTYKPKYDPQDEPQYKKLLKYKRVNSSNEN